MSSYRFRPGLITSLVALVALPTFIWLGFWQLERTAEMQGMQQQFEQRVDLPTLRLGPKARAHDDLEYRRVFVRGRWDAEHQILIDNKTHQGQAGYYVITPLKMTGSDQYILINRGWLPAGNSRTELPEIDVIDRQVTVHGVLHKSRRDIYMISDKNRDISGWPARYQWLDIDEFARETKFKVYPFVVLMDADAPYGYSRQWKPLNVDSDKNTRYAMLWFSFAILLVIIYFVVNIKKHKVE